MKLEIKNCKYISPSTFAILKECMMSAWINKWAGLEWDRTQTMPMAVGSAFDAFIKVELSKVFGETRSETLLINLLNNIQVKDAISIGKQLADEYIEQRCLHRLMDDGLAGIEVDYKEQEIDGVPVRCILDAYQKDGTPVDWKVNGYGSKYGGKIHKGYTRLVQQGMEQPRSERASLNQIDSKWADQMGFYWEMLNDPKLPTVEKAGPRCGHIEQVCIKPTGLSFVTYESNIDTPYWNEQLRLLKSFWEKIQQGEIDEPLACNERCHPYGNPRPCTGLCPYYKKFTQGTDLMSQIIRRN